MDTEPSKPTTQTRDSQYMASTRRLNAKGQIVEYNYIKKIKYPVKERGTKYKRNYIRLNLSSLNDDMISKIYDLMGAQPAPPQVRITGPPVRPRGPPTRRIIAEINDDTED
jgi:hypothetical protein